MKITIPGRPVPAVRMTQRSKFKSKQAQRYLDYKKQVGWEARAIGIKEPISGPVTVMAKAFIRFINGKVPDCDNLAKSFLDGLNEIAWYDDAQVNKLTIERIFVATKAEERAEIEILQEVPA